MTMFNPAHPGEVLQEYIGAVEVGEFAAQIGVSRSTLSRILHGRAGITAEMSLRLSERLKTSPGLWLRLQMQYDLWHAMQKRKAERRTERALARAKPVAIEAEAGKRVPAGRLRRAA